MKSIYVVNVRYTGCNGGIIDCTEDAYVDEATALNVCYKMIERNQDDMNFMAYVTGPILLYE